MTSASVQTKEQKQAVIQKVDELNALAWELRRTDPKRSLMLAEEAHCDAQAAHYERGQAYSLLTLSYSAIRSSNLQTAQSKVQRALESFNASDDQEGRRQALNTLGIIYGQSGNYAGALKTFLTLQRLCAELGDPQAAADALNNTGVAYFHLGDYTHALDYHFRAQAAFRTSEHPSGEVHALINIGMVYFERGHFQEALDAFSQAQKGEAEDDYTKALLCNHLGRTYLALGHHEQALAHNQESLALMNTLADPLGASYTQDDLAAIYLQLGQTDEAERCLLESLAVKRGAGDSKGEAEVCLQLGGLYLHKGQLEPALDTLHEGLACAQASHAKIEIHKAHQALAEAYKKNRQFREACFHLEKHTQLSKEVFNQESDLRLQGLRVQHEVKETEREKELYRLKNVELAQAIEALHTLTASLQAANDDKSALLKQLERQAYEDALTGLYNRRHLDETLEQAFAHARRYERPLSVVVCDIDYFKRVNDTFSHQMGDTVLKEVARLLQCGVRQSDTVARYGGEEFVILLPEAPAETARGIIERIRRTIANHSWHTYHPDLTVTISAGLTDDLSAPCHEKLIALADKKLYEAKDNGRNQVRA